MLAKCVQTKVQVRQEDRYHGLRRTIRTIWEVSLTSFFRPFWTDARSFQSNAEYLAFSTVHLYE